MSLAKFRFRWKYAISAFLVCGVLSLTIGAPKAPDPLVKEANEIQAHYNLLFKINKHTRPEPSSTPGAGTAERVGNGASLKASPKKSAAVISAVATAKKAENYATGEELDGPAEKTFGQESGLYQGFVAELKAFGLKLSAASFERAKNPNFTVDSDSNKAVVDAAIIYSSLQLKLYANYMRLAHDAAFETFRPTSSVDFFIDYLLSTSRSPSADAALKDAQRWKSLNQEALATPGARAFSPNALDYLNLVLSPKSGLRLYKNEELGKRFSLRNIKDEKGEYTKVELFMNAFDKQMLEYAALSQPASLGEYLKLLQFAAIREGITNRWAIRRMQPGKVYADVSIPACGRDLVSFRPSKPGGVGGLEAYDSLWQEDRRNDVLIQGHAAVAAVAANRPLLSEADTALVIVQYLSLLPSFRNEVLPEYRDKLNNLVSDVQSNYAVPVVQIAENLFSLKDETGIANSQRTFLGSSLPADDLTFPAVADRFADRAFLMRKLYLVDAIVTKLGSDHYAKNDPVAPGRLKYPEVVRPEAKKIVRELVEKSVAQSETIWKASLAKDSATALAKALGPPLKTKSGSLREVGYTNDRNAERFKEFLIEMRPAAVLGVRGLTLADSAEKAMGKLVHDFQRPSEACQNGGRGIDSSSCYSAEDYLNSVKKRDRNDPTLYLGAAPFRTLAEKAGLAQYMLPRTADQLSQAFYKKLALASSFTSQSPNLPAANLANYAEVDIANAIRENPNVMHGLELFFSEVSSAFDERMRALAATPICKAEHRADGVDCGDDPYRESPAALQALDDALLPSLKTAFATFQKDLDEPSKYKSEDRAQAKSKEDFLKWKSEAGKIMPAVQDQLSLSRVNPHLAQILNIEKQKQATLDRQARAAAEKVRQRRLHEIGYFRVGSDRSFQKIGGEYAARDAKDRAETIRLFKQATAMMGLSAKGMGVANAVFVRNSFFMPEQVKDWHTTEYLIARMLPNARLIDRMFATVTDQLALGMALKQEAIMKSPILTLQTTWKREKESKEPILLRRLVAAWSTERGWNDKVYAETVRRTVNSASQNDTDKVETFCRADIKSYQTDPDFKLMFGAITGIRDALSGNPQLKIWDDRITKETRTLTQVIMEDYVDPYSTAIGMAMLLLMIWQFAPIILTIFGAPAIAGWMTTSAASAVATFFGGFGQVAFWMLTSNVGPVMLLFSLQSYLMISTYHFKLPPQLDYTYQLANSRVQNMGLGKFAGRGLVDRGKMDKANEELSSQQTWAIVGGLGEVMNAAFIYHEVRATVGLAGRAKLNRLFSDSEFATREAAESKSLRGLIAEKGSVVDGAKEYLKDVSLKRIFQARIPVVKGTKEAKDAIYTALRDRLGKMAGEVNLNGLLETELQAERDRIALIEHVLGWRYTKKYARVQSLGREFKQVSELHREIAQLEAILRMADDESKGFITIVIEKKWAKTHLAEDGIVDFLKSTATFTGKRRWRAMIALAAEMRGPRYKIRMYEKMLAKLKGPASETRLIGKTSEEVNFFANASIDELDEAREMLSSSEFIAPKVRKQITQAYSDADYLHEDWREAYKPMQAFTRLLGSGNPDRYYDQNGDEATLNLIDFRENPEDYEVLTLGSGAAKALGSP
jgi:hypothetical protein